MSYHDATFRLLGKNTDISAAAKLMFNESEHRLGIKMPMSLREWYERESAIVVLADCSNQDPPIEVSRFKIVAWHGKRLMPIRNENQGVCTWAVEIDGGENPAVLVEVDSNGTHWDVLANSFSEYVFSCVWDYKLVHMQPALVQAQNIKLSGAAIDLLSREFVPVLSTRCWPGSAQYRFQGSGCGVLIWDSPEQADWFVGARDAESLRVALETIGNIDLVSKQFYDCSTIGREVLAGLRKG
jgi:hypothetical protein